MRAAAEREKASSELLLPSEQETPVCRQLAINQHKNPCLLSLRAVISVDHFIDEKLRNHMFNPVHAVKKALWITEYSDTCHEEGNMKWAAKTCQDTKAGLIKEHELQAFK